MWIFFSKKMRILYMRNKLLLVSAIAALGLSSVAFAGGLPCEMPPAPCAVCSDSGVYIGLEGGYGMTNWKNLDGYLWTDPTDIASGDFPEAISVSDSDGLVGRGFIGYNINKYFAIEGGFTQFGTKRTHISEHDGVIVSALDQAIDLEFKLSAPLTDEFYVYGKLGADYLMTNVREEAPITVGNLNHINVLFGAGVDYCVTPNIIINAEWMRYNGNPDMSSGTDDYWFKNYQPYADAFMVGIRYRFDM